jgi:HlyD family secretion protein
MLDATVEQVAADAAAPDQSGREATLQAQSLAYRTTVALQQQTLGSEGGRYPLASGMRLSAEIKLGERTILEYLLSPVRKAFHEAARER